MSAIPQDQAMGLRLLVAAQQAEESAPRAVACHASSVLAIASGKGGVGKTNIAVNLAIVLARTGHRVLLVDADIGTANVDVIMNVQAPYDLSHVLRGQRRLDDVVLRIDERLRIVAGASGLATIADLTPFDRSALIEDLTRFERQCDVIILDCGAGISQNVLAFAQAAGEMFLVTTPEPTALTDAYALAKAVSLGPQPPSMRLVVNIAGTMREGRKVADRIASVAARYLGIPLDCAGLIPADPLVTRAVRRRVPLVLGYPRAPAATGISALARQVPLPAGSAPTRPAFFRRLLGFFTESPQCVRRCQQ
jgi:flagellar biosynthesis protein FlhG